MDRISDGRSLCSRRCPDAGPAMLVLQAIQDTEKSAWCPEVVFLISNLGQPVQNGMMCKCCPMMLTL